MFQALRQGNPVYILHRGEKPKCSIGNVVGVSNPVPKFPNNFNMYQQPQEMVVDIKVKCGESTLEFQKLPANNTVADLNQSNESLFISTNRDAVNMEIENMLRQSREIVDSVSYHKSIIGECEKMLKNLNPEFAKSEEQEEKIKQLTQIIEEQKKRIEKLPTLDEIRNLLKPETPKNSK